MSFRTWVFVAILFISVTAGRAFSNMKQQSIPEPVLIPANTPATPQKTEQFAELNPDCAAILVRFNEPEPVNPELYLASTFGISVEEFEKISFLYKFELGSCEKQTELLAAMNKDPKIKYAELDQVVQIQPAVQP